MNSNLVKQCFGNHNTLYRYLKFINRYRVTNNFDTNDFDIDEIPLFKPVLYRQIACEYNNDDILMKNANSKHIALNKLVMRELINNYINYQQLTNIPITN